MSRWSGIAGVALIAVAAAGCRADGAAPVADPTTSSASPTVSAPTSTPTVGGATLQNPLGEGKIDADLAELRDAVLQEIPAAGGARIRVTGGPRSLAFELGPAAVVGAPAVQRISWQESGTAHEQLVLPDGRVCADRAEGRALEMDGERTFFDSGRNVHLLGTIQASGRPYSCTRQPSDLGYGSFVTRELLALEPVTRLGRMMGAGQGLDMTDVGLETDAQGATTRHLRYLGYDLNSTEHRVPTTVDVWVDGDLRLVRAEFNDLDGRSRAHVATFTYGGVPPVVPPDAADRGPLGIRLASPARQVSTSDQRGDVEAVLATDWFVPSIDITGVQITFDAVSSMVEFRIGFADLLALRHDRERLAQTITISGDRMSGFRSLRFSRTVQGNRVVVVTTATLLHYGSRERPCGGATSTVDTSADTILLAVPERCVTHSTGPERFSVVSQGGRGSGPRSGRSVASDQLDTARALLTR